jgi:hypothetical protein
MAQDAVGEAINHPIRKRLIEALWHCSEPLSAHRFHSEYADGDQVTLQTISYHLRVLDRYRIAKVDREEPAGGSVERFYVLDGPNSAEAIRRLGLA